MIFAANRCRDRAPNIYIADDYAEIANIVNPRLGDVAFVIASGVFQSWRLVESESVADGLETIQSNACEFVWVLSNDTSGGQGFPLELFGAIGDGATDDSAAFGSAAILIPIGGVITGTVGRTYVLDAVQINRDVSIDMTGATLLHKPLATADMITYTVPCTGFVQGGTWNGNKANQILTTNAGRKSLLSFYSDGAIVRDIKAINYVRSFYFDFRTISRSDIDNCKCLDGAEQGGAGDLANGTMPSAGIWIDYNNQTGAKTPVFNIRNCKVSQSADESAPGYAPGGIIVLGRAPESIFPRVTVDNCDFERTGQNVNGSHIAAGVDLYKDSQFSTVTNNRVKRPFYTPFKLQDASQITCTTNQIDGEGTTIQDAGILIDFQTRADSLLENRNAIIANNQIRNMTGASVTAIIVQGVLAKSRQAIIKGNIIDNCNGGISIQGAIGIDKDLIISDNIVEAVAAGFSALTFANFDGVASISNNHFKGGALGGHGCSFQTGVSSGVFNFDNNYFESSAAGNYPFAVFSMGELHARGNRFNAVNGGAAVRIEKAATQPVIGKVLFPPDNIIQNGTVNIDFANITEILDRIAYAGSPEGVASAREGVEWIVPSGALRGLVFRKTTWAVGSESLGWQIVMAAAHSSIVSGNHNLGLHERFVSIDCTGGNRIATLHSAAALPGVIVALRKNDATVNTATITPVEGGDIVLSTIYDAKMLVSNGVVWRRFDFI